MERSEDRDKNDQVYLPHIPHDISFDILSWLPVKTIYNFRSVCKLWCLLPNDQKFVKTHLTRSRQASNVIVMSYTHDEGYRHTLLSFYFMDISETGNVTKLMFTTTLDLDIYSMEPSLDGLVCFTALLSKNMYVCNPSTHELLQLPEVDSRSVIAGFGFDYVTGTYKVLRASVELRDGSVEWFIYTLGSGDDNWRPLGHMPFDYYQIKPGENAYINGVVHWMLQCYDRSDPYAMLSFNFHDESFWFFPIPRCPAWRLYLEYHVCHAGIHLKVMGGYLRLIAILDASDAGFWTIGFWALKDYTNYRWTCDVRFNIRILNHNMKLYKPVPVDMRNGKMFFSSGNKLYSHDLKRDITAEVSDGLPAEVAEHSKDYRANYAESFIPIKSKFWY